MCRSRLLAAAAALFLASTAWSAATQFETHRVLSPIGMLDFEHGREAVKVGSWVKYHVTGKSELGVIEDYEVTMLIAGEEDLWGDEGFWLETLTTGAKRMTASRTAVLMSYAVFDDSLALANVNIYRRKVISEVDEAGHPIERLIQRGEDALTKRTLEPEGLHRKMEILGTDTLKTAKGEFICVKERYERGLDITSQSPDSSKETEQREVRVDWRTPAIPITGIAHEDLDVGVWERTWLIGHSSESGPKRVKDRSKGSIDLVDFGTSGVPSLLTPEIWRHTLAEQRAARAAAAGPRPARPAGAAKPAARHR